MAKLSQKLFEELAKEIGHVHAIYENGLEVNNYHTGVYNTTRAIMSVLARHNPRFNKAKFDEAIATQIHTEKQEWKDRYSRR